MAVALTVTLEPARMAALVTVTGLTVGQPVTVTRTAPSGNVATIRGGNAANATAATMTFRDYEAPLDVPLTYTATQGAFTATTSFTAVWGRCQGWLVDLARPTNSLPVTIESLAELQFEIASGVHRILNRRAPVMTSLPAWTPAAELVILTDTLPERDQVRALYGSGFPILLRTSPEEGVGNMYLGVTGFREARFLTDGYAPERRFDADVVQVERPDPGLFVPTPPNTYANVKAAWATYADLKAGVGTYDELAYTYPANPDANPVIPWLPDDV